MYRATVGASSEDVLSEQLPARMNGCGFTSTSPTGAAAAGCAQIFDFPAELVNEICDPPLRQHVSAWEGVLFGHLADFRREFDADSTEFAWLHFALGERFLITGRVKAVQSAERLRQTIGVGNSFTIPASLLSHLLSLYSDVLDMALHRLSDELEMIEDHVLDEHHRGERKRLMLTRREIAQLHRHMRAMRGALQTAERASIPTPEGFRLAAGTAQQSRSGLRRHGSAGALLP